MIGYFLLTVIVVSLFILIWGVSKLVQINSFSNYLEQAIDDFYDERGGLIREGDNFKDHEIFKKNFNVYESYDNLNRSFPWNYNFNSMIVYDPIK